MNSIRLVPVVIGASLCLACLLVFVELMSIGKPSMAPSLTAVGPDGNRYPVIARLEGRLRTITVIPGPGGPLYSAATRDGVAIVDFASLELLRDKHREIYNEVRSGVAADAALIIDARLPADERLLHDVSGVKPDSSKLVFPAGRTTDRFYDASE